MPKMSLAIMFNGSRGICEAEERSLKNTGAGGALSLRGFVVGYLCLIVLSGIAGVLLRKWSALTFQYFRGVINWSKIGR